LKSTIEMRKLLILSCGILTAFSCTYKHEGKLIKDVDGKIYRLEGSQRTSEAYHLIEIDTTNLYLLK